jgi:lipopolysaccharide transport system permease protein
MPREPVPVTIIEPTAPWRLPDLGQIWAFRDLLLLLIRRDFTVRYRQTLLGPAWLLLQPLALTGVFTLIFRIFAAMPTQGRPAVLFYFSGLIGWTYVAQVLAATAGTFVGNSSLFSKVRFPRLIMPLAAGASGLFAVVLQLLLLGAIMAAIGEPFFGWRLLILPVLMLAFAGLSWGVGLWIASSTAKYRDLSIATPFLLQLWLFATPVIYPLSSVPQDWRLAVALLNPLAPLIEALRWILIGAGSVEPLPLAVAALEIAIILLTGAMLFQRVERTAVDTV